MDRPRSTRLRYARASEADLIVAFLSRLSRVQIYGSPVWVESEQKWYLWFVPADTSSDIKSIDLD